MSTLLERSSAMTRVGEAPPPSAAACCCEEGVDDAHHFAGRRVLQVDDVDFVVALLVDALDDAHDAADVAGAVGEDEDVAGGVGRHVSRLRHQRAQHRHQLRGVHVLDGDHLRDQFVGAGAHAVRQVDVGHLARVGIGNDLDDPPDSTATNWCTCSSARKAS